MGKLTLYGIDGSPPVRSVILTLRALGLDFEYKVVNLQAGEQLKPEFLKLNPLHTVPVLDDDGFILYDSHAINSYLVGKFSKDDSLYPRDLQKRALVDQRLFYESGTVAPAGVEVMYTVLRQDNPEVPQAKIDALAEAYKNLNLFLKDSDFLAGDNLTIADFHVLAVLTGWVYFLEIEPSKYPRLAGWIQRMKRLPYYEEANGARLELILQLIKAKNFKIV
ncbi:glutathione S-transferase 1-1-like [Drosophila bipectinata]|uniref:glutathione S-transferase 1-1-like n=1 Tax=Drosophila bipectinata TaxID=42026 RepID=UPI001C89A435|nr:glutathione S-transferase 1-1-like [Drosophila bipectinata]